jgi:hypothetical protein
MDCIALYHDPSQPASNRRLSRREGILVACPSSATACRDRAQDDKKDCCDRSRNGECTGEICDDGIDNDGDGNIDSADPACGVK